MEEFSEERARVVEEAATWLVSLEEDPEGQLQQPFRDWLAASKLRVDEFLLISAVQHEIARLGPRFAHLRHISRGGLEDQPVVAPVGYVSPRTRTYAWAITVSVVIIVLLGFFRLALREPSEAQRLPADVYVTGAEERRIVGLGPGASMHMNVKTRAEVVSIATERRIRLLSGEALFVISDASHKPLYVISGTSRIQDVGTKFDVRREEGSTTISVADGTVLLSAECDSVLGRMRRSLGLIWGASTKWPTAITARGQVSISDGCAPEAVVKQLDRHELARIIAWGDRWLELDDVSLRDAIDRFNRFNHKQLVLADKSFADIRIGGGFWGTDVDSFLTVLREQFGMKAISSFSSDGRETIQLVAPECHQARARCAAAKQRSAVP